ncbi:MAG TPA: M23 family metallopeptidase [Patescibacteria group bacterium]|nr:M23 family metallopeptidase [Patescibacteria group bacterium]
MKRLTVAFLTAALLFSTPSLALAADGSLFSGLFSLFGHKEIPTQTDTSIQFLTASYTDYVNTISAQESQDQNASPSAVISVDPTQTQDKIDPRLLPIPAEFVKGISTYFRVGHPGIDIRANLGTPIYAMKSGTVIDMGYEAGGYGRYAVIAHDDNGSDIRSLYAHMRKTFIQVGEQIDSKSVIGEVGMTGNTSGPHLHFEVHIGNTPIDPIKYLTGKVNFNLIAKK